MPPILVFDLMDTLIRDPFFWAIPAHLGTTMPELLQAKHPRSWLEFELGQIEEAEFFQRFYRDARQLADPQGLKRAFSDNYHFIEGMEELLTELHASGQTLWLLSNYPLWFEEIWVKHQLNRFFAGHTVSYQCGLRKPDPRIYHLVQAQTGAKSWILIDDRQPNLTAAQQLGWGSILFTDPQQLRAQLNLDKGL
jgi:HAD superfamily hydrolase (TIGR01509 family)